MNSQNNYTVEDVLEIVNTLPEKDKGNFEKHPFR